jgi:uncharacterized protein YegP (UPF0339 family)
MAYIQHFQSTNRKWYWHLKDNNHKIIAASGGDGYETEPGVLQAIRNVISEFKRFK